MTRYLTHRSSSLTLALSLLALTPAAAAQPSRPQQPPRAPQVLAREDLHGRAVRLERTGEGTAALIGVGATPITLPIGSGADARATTQRLSVGAGTVLVLRVGGASPAAAVITASPAMAPTALFAGALAAQGPDPGEMRTPVVIVDDVNPAWPGPEVIVGERREDVPLCGLGAALVNARVVEPASLRLVPVSLNPLRPSLLDRAPQPARPLNATPVQGATRPAITPHNFVTRVAGGVPGTSAAALTDGNAATVWQPRTFEFVSGPVTLAGFELQRIVLVAPPAPATLPRALTVLLGDGTRLEVAIDPASAPPGGRVALPIVPARTTRCLTLVATEGPRAGAPAAIADIELGTSMSAQPARELVQRLDGPHADQAAQLLGQLGDVGIDATAEALPTLSDAGAHHAIRLLATARTARSAAALAGALDRTEPTSPDRVDIRSLARTALQRMGPAALEPLAAVLPSNARAADLIASPRQGPLEARLRAMAAGLAAEAPVWRQIRGPAESLVREAAGAGQFEQWLALVPAEPARAARALTVAVNAASDDAQRAAVAARARAIYAAATSFEDRYRLLRPLVGDAEGRAILATLVREEPDADLRHRAVESLRGVAGSEPVLLAALEDRTPRVRAAAADGLAGHAPARAALLTHLQRDSWPTVRARAAAALARDGANAPALIAALDDPAVVTVRAAIEALTETPGAAVGARLMAYAESSRNNPDLRGEALEGLSRRCEAGMVDRLLALFNRLNDPVLPPTEQQVGQQALAAAARISPARVRRAMREMEMNQFGAAAIARAMRNACPGDR